MNLGNGVMGATLNNSDAPTLTEFSLTLGAGDFRPDAVVINGQRYVQESAIDAERAYARAAVATEREACAVVADGAGMLEGTQQDLFNNGWWSCAIQVAQAIRARATMETHASST